jgi:hypothetical protein
VSTLLAPSHGRYAQRVKHKPITNRAIHAGIPNFLLLFFLVVYFIELLVRNRNFFLSEKCLRSSCPTNDSVKWRLHTARSQSYHSVPIFSVIVFFFLLLLLLTFLCASITHAGEDHDSYSKPSYRDAVESK